MMREWGDDTVSGQQHWVGLGDWRRYLLATDEWGIRWPWHRTEDGWGHTIDPCGSLAGGWWTCEPANQSDVTSLATHVAGIPLNGCGVRGYCHEHSAGTTPEEDEDE